MDKKQRAKFDSALTEAESRAKLVKAQEALNSSTVTATSKRSRSSRSETGERYSNMPPQPSWWDGDAATTHNLVAMRELKNVRR